MAQLRERVEQLEQEQLKAREDRQRQQVERRSITDLEVRHVSTPN